jgi:hypothetical protein
MVAVGRFGILADGRPDTARRTRRRRTDGADWGVGAVVSKDALSSRVKQGWIVD